MRALRVFALLASLSLLLGLALPTAPASAWPAALSLVVNSVLVDAVDANPGDGVCETASGNGVCTLRAAVIEANASPGADSIYVPAGTYYLSLVATENEGAALDGDLDLTDDVTITGAGEAATIIDGNRSISKARVFEIMPGVTVTMTHLTVRNGTNELGPHGIDGGVINAGTAYLSHVTLTGNDRGGFANKGTAVLDHVTYTHNTGNTAPLSNGNGGTLIVMNSTIANNINQGFGGGLSLGIGEAMLINSTVSGNQAPGLGDGAGGIFVFNSTLTIINSTISGNQAAAEGGGVYVLQSAAELPTVVNMHNVTLVNNVADTLGGGNTGGGLYVAASPGRVPTINLVNTLIANNRRRLINSEPTDCYGPVISAGYNLVETTTGCTINGITTGLITGQDPTLDVLADNGGPTQTHALGGYSPALDAGNPAGCADPLGVLLAADQRGEPRVRKGRCDLGAFELWLPTSFLYLPFVQR